MSQPVPIPGRTNQYTQEVEEYQHFNGATCLVIVDLTNFGNALALKEVMAGRPGPTDDELGDAIEKEIRRQITKCPTGSDVKVQLLYHATAKTLPEKRGKNRMWKMQNSIKKTLKNFQANNEPRFKKLFLCGCNSQQDDLDLVSEAFKIPSIVNVVTFWDIIYLNPGRVSGANLGYQPQELSIYVWSKDAQGKQIAKKPKTPIDDDEELDLNTLYVEKKKATAAARCPTQHARTGSGSVKVGSYKSRKAASSAIVSVGSTRTPFPYTDAVTEANDDMNGFSCTNSSCQSKTVSAIRVTKYRFEIRSSVLRMIFSVLGGYRWVVVCKYDWASRITCR